MIVLAVSSPSLFRFFEITSPDVETFHSDGTEVAGIIKYLMANGYKFGKLPFPMFTHHSKGLLFLSSAF
jgi:hypothetical protein